MVCTVDVNSPNAEIVSVAHIKRRSTLAFRHSQSTVIPCASCGVSPYSAGENMKLLILILAVAATADEERKWVWGGEGKDSKGDNRNSRYNVYENQGDGPNYPNQFRPQYPGPYGPNSRPIGPGAGSQILVGPNGPSGFGGRPDYRPIRPSGDGFDYNSGPVVPGVNVDPILAGPVPSWIRNDPRYQEFDSCKCSRGFNCPGLKFGSCARGKQYCCFSSRKYQGGRPGYDQFNGNYPNRPYQGSNLPFRPFNAIPSEYYENSENYDGNYNGNYNGNNYGQYQNGAGGNYGRPQNNYNRPYYGNNGDYDGTYQGPYAPDYSGNYNSYNQGGGFDWQNPYRRPYDYDNYARSGGRNKNSKNSTDNDASTTSSTTEKGN